MLVLFFLYIAYIALAGASAGRHDSGGSSRVAAIFGLVGAANLPIIHYSVLWWRTLHQGQSITLTKSTIDGSILWPLPVALVGFTLLFVAIVLIRMRTLLAQGKIESRLRRMADA
jgi:heme exporter protein C